MSSIKDVYDWYVKEGYISCVKQGGLSLYNYTDSCVFQNNWNFHTKSARGLVLDKDGKVIAKPFDRFWNLNERPETTLHALPQETPELSEKYDGCFEYRTGITLSNGKSLHIGKIHEKFLKGKKFSVLSYDFKEQKIVPKNVLAVHKKSAPAFLKVSFTVPAGFRTADSTICTPNHEFMTQRGWVSADKLKTGDTVYQLGTAISKPAEEVLFGCLLGDASLMTLKNKKENYFGSPYIRICQGNEQYLISKHRIFKSISGKVKKVRSGFGKDIFRFDTRHLNAFDHLATLFRPNHEKKSIPVDVEKYLTPISMAYWYMDDGSLAGTRLPNKTNFIHLHTEGFTREENEILAKALENRYGKKVSVYRSKNKYNYIGVNCAASKKIFEEIASFIPPCMQYKLPNYLRNSPQEKIEPCQLKWELKPVLVKNVEHFVPQNTTNKFAYDLTVEDNHNYFANGRLVHNSMMVVFENPETGHWQSVTRGCWDNIQTQFTNKWLANGNSARLDSGYTYLFELIAPWNRIVVMYPKEDLVLIGVVHTESARDFSYKEVREYAIAHGITPVYFENKPLHSLKMDDPSVVNQEGFVARFSNGFRVKIKYENYVLLHRIVTGLSIKGIWESLSSGKDIDLTHVPEEFRAWFVEEKLKLFDAYREIEKRATLVFETIPKTGTRKESALEILKHKDIAAILFQMLDKNPNYTETIWKMVKPVGFKTFQNNNTEEKNCG